MDETLREYRKELERLEQASQSSYDRTILSLSGGALAVSFAFVRDVVGSGSVQGSSWLFSGWLAWAAAIVFVLFSHLTSHAALRTAVRQLDAETLWDERPGGWSDVLTKIYNVLGGVMFVAGIVLVARFVWLNLQ